MRGFGLDKYYEGKASAPVIPSVFAAYKKGDWTISGFFGITGGGGKASFDDGLSIIAVSIMVQRALNCVDPRLVDHGLRVAAVLDAMLEAKGVTDPTQRRAAYLVALLHDVGAYRTEEIDRMVAFETESVWEHSFYGYLFFKELTPLGAYADVILYHHLPYDRFTDQDPYVKFLAGAVHVPTGWTCCCWSVLKRMSSR